jgi:hypothetical protein
MKDGVFKQSQFLILLTKKKDYFGELQQITR